MQTKKGFTIIELTLAIMFIAILLMLVAFVLVDVGKVYQKGVTTKEMNQLGREVMDSVRRDLSQTSSDKVKFREFGSGQNKTYRLCLGSVSYVANSGTLLNNDPGSGIFKNGVVSDKIRLIRTNDSGSEFCADSPIGNVTDSTASELLSNGSTNLAVQNMKVTKLATDSQQGLFRVSVTLGTNEKDTLDAEKRCRTLNAEDGQKSNYDYCSVAEFTTIVRTGGSRE